MEILKNKFEYFKDVANLIVMGNIKRIGIAAHNNKKAELIECLQMHRDILAKHKLYGTGTTGSMVEKELQIPVTKYESGPFGGDQQLGAKITKRELDILIFFVDPLDAHAHGADVNASETETNRTFMVRVRFGSIEFLKIGSGSVRFD